jgi:NADH:ubiquinone oxidoreductase subunit F (NADH-binding)/NADH:ubiquinone oxidoreductase subunit E
VNLIEELVALQEHHGYLRDADLEALHERTGAPLYEIQGLCSFYPHFRRRPPATRRIAACRDLACHLRDGGAALERLRARCNDVPDTEFEPVSCLGRCDIAPACVWNDVPMCSEDAITALKATTPSPPAVRSAATAAAPRSWALDPYESVSERYGVLREWVESGDADGAALIERVTRSGLRGMGGAGFPTGRKWSLVADASATPRYVICNADESEPGTFKDRAVLAELPHLMLEGMALAGLAVGASEGWIYVRHEYGPETGNLREAIAAARTRGALGAGIFGSAKSFDVQIFVSPGGYILGEETALLEALEGKRGEPRNKPPYPVDQGLHGKPTLINNVETFAQVPRAVRTERVETKLFSVSGDVEEPRVVEAPFGTTLDELIRTCGGMRDGRELLAFLPGGASTGFLPAAQRNLPLDWDSLREAGSSLGSAAVIVVGEGADLRALAGNLTAFFRNESCGKCVPCRLGTDQAVQLIERGDAASLARIRVLHETMAATSICGLGQAALIPIVSVLDGFGDKAPAGDPS